MSGLKKCTRLTELSLAQCTAFSDCRSSQRAAALCRSTSFCRTNEFLALAGCYTLTALNLSWCHEVSDVSALVGCSSLASLEPSTVP